MNRSTLSTLFVAIILGACSGGARDIANRPDAVEVVRDGYTFRVVRDDDVATAVHYENSIVLVTEPLRVYEAARSAIENVTSCGIKEFFHVEDTTIYRARLAC